MLDNNLQSRLDHYQENGLLRQRFILHRRDLSEIKISQKNLINFSGNDYLGIATDPKVKRALIRGADQFGLGSGASALVSGAYQPHLLLEERFASFLKRDQSMLFNSGYMANLAVITTLAKHHQMVVIDKLCHASIIDGVKLSGLKFIRFRHNDFRHLETILEKYNRKCLIISESVFSIDGDICPIENLVAIAKNFQATLVIDDAHGLGVLGESGRGISERFSLEKQDITCLVNPLGKSLGSFGAIVSGSKVLIDSLMQFSRTYMYSTALPPAIALATMTALNILESESWRRDRLQLIIKHFINQADQLGLEITNKDLTPIKSIIIGDNTQAEKIKNLLLHNGFFVSCMRPPSVARGTARLRISLNCYHQKTDIDRLLEIIAESLHFIAKKEIKRL